MHIAEGFLPAPIWIGGYACTGLATWFSLYQIHQQQDPTQGIPKASLLTAAFFVASSIYIPIPPASVHLVLNGLLGVILGYYAFPAILIGLFFQAVVFGHGGLSTLGINAAMMGLPALLAYQIFRLHTPLSSWFSERQALGISAFLGGSLGLGLAVLIFYRVVLTTIPSGFESDSEQVALWTLIIAHVPIIILEGVFTSLVVLFLHRIKPELLPLGR
ncbi:MAG: cobalt transporter CbiM [Synechococcaceae cyanobacterium SM2_3_1]|nr:cobalt transporter CbiM [Synechococcaceae cyanobacterium SM2_3_1]